MVGNSCHISHILSYYLSHFRMAKILLLPKAQERVEGEDVQSVEEVPEGEEGEDVGSLPQIHAQSHQVII